MTTPEPDTQRRSEKSSRYAAISQRLLRQAQEELDAGDTLQASEKAYGAATHAAKACGELRGWNHYGHFRVGRIIDQLRDEWQDSALTVAYLAVEALHNNFFEHNLEATRVQDGINATKALTGRLEEIRNSDPRPLLSASLSREQRVRLSLLMPPPPPLQDENDYNPDALPPVEPAVPRE